MNTQSSPTTEAAPVKTAADFYDELFLDVLCLPWAEHLTETAPPAPGSQVLDVACGTGAVAGVAWRILAGQGTVLGLDARTDMLDVARRKLPELDWSQGHAESLPFEDARFDVVYCQFGLMFFEDRQQAVREMHRVLKPGGRVALAVWDALEHAPAYVALIDLIDLITQHLGADSGKTVSDPFSLGDPPAVRALLEGAGFASVEAASVAGTANFESLQAWIDAEVKGWIGSTLDEEQYATFFAEAERTLARYVGPDGRTDFELPAVVASGCRTQPITG